MAVRVDAAVQDHLIAEHDGHTYYFCRAACLAQFTANPAQFVNTHAHAAQAPGAGTAVPVIDAGMRQWYESCSCCLSDAFPEVKATLDAEREALAQATADPGICEVAEAGADTR